KDVPSKSRPSSSARSARMPAPNLSRRERIVESIEPEAGVTPGKGSPCPTILMRPPIVGRALRLPECELCWRCFQSIFAAAKQKKARNARSRSGLGNYYPASAVKVDVPFPYGNGRVTVAGASDVQLRHAIVSKRPSPLS